MSHTCQTCGTHTRPRLEDERHSKALKSNARYHHDTKTWKNLKIRKAWQKRAEPIGVVDPPRYEYLDDWD